MAFFPWAMALKSRDKGRLSFRLPGVYSLIADSLKSGFRRDRPALAMIDKSLRHKGLR
jgi:hypothetical protein